MFVSLSVLTFHITDKSRVSCINWDGNQSSNRNDSDLCNNIEAVKENILEQRRNDEVCKGCLITIRFRVETIRKGVALLNALLLVSRSDFFSHDSSKPFFSICSGNVLTPLLKRAELRLTLLNIL